MKQALSAFSDPKVKAVFERYPSDVREKLLQLRQLILDTAADTAGVGLLQETLKWGEPAYLTTHSKSGSTVRIHCTKDPTRYAMYFNCNTTLVDSFRSLFPHTFRFEANRALVFDLAEPVPLEELAFCIAMALTYHQKKTAAR